MTTKRSRAAALLGAALLVAPIIVLGASAPSSAGAATTTRLLTCTGKLTFKPSTYVLSCADYGAGWTEMTWSVWNASTASGHGFLRQNDCTPNCASGKFVDYRGTVTLSKVITTKRYGRLFSAAVFHYTDAGKEKTEIFGPAD
jgi:hypothetical protein